MIILNQLGIRYLSEWEFPRWNEYRDNGALKSYVVDIVVIDPRYYNRILEIGGEGSASKDNEKRDLYFARLGLWIEHLANEQVRVEEILSTLDGHERGDEYS